MGKDQQKFGTNLSYLAKAIVVLWQFLKCVEVKCRVSRKEWQSMSMYFENE